MPWELISESNSALLKHSKCAESLMVFKKAVWWLSAIPQNKNSQCSASTAVLLVTLHEFSVTMPMTLEVFSRRCARCWIMRSSQLGSPQVEMYNMWTNHGWGFPSTGAQAVKVWITYNTKTLDWDALLLIQMARKFGTITTNTFHPQRRSPNSTILANWKPQKGGKFQILWQYFIDNHSNNP